VFYSSRPRSSELTGRGRADHGPFRKNGLWPGL